ncbi:MAG: tetratricopeptide repeat protein [Geitlerinemataceae cyanobacterium]
MTPKQKQKNEANETEDFLSFKRGNILTKEGKLKEAIKEYQKAIDLNFKSSQYHFQLGTVFSKQGQWSEAVKCYRNTIQVDPKFAIAYCNLGDALSRVSEPDRDRKDEIESCYKKAIEIDPDLAKAYQRLGDLLTQKRNIKEAISCYKTASQKQIAKLNPKFCEHNSTSSPVKKPDFAIIGSMKCGTTSLYEYIAKHPDFLPCINKEIHFFSTKFWLGVDWYLAQFPSLPQGENFFTGEASTSYFDYPDVSKRINEFFPEMKIIILLRNPVHRAFSHYNHVKKQHPGKELRSFEEAIDEEINAIEKSNFYSSLKLEYLNKPYGYLEYGYVVRGLYLYFLKSWLSYFSREKIFIVKSEDFYQDPEKTTSEVLNFLGVSNLKLDRYIKYNAGSYNTKKASAPSQLTKFFEVHNKKLEKYLGIDLNW